jgi:hypothetical protein
MIITLQPELFTTKIFQDSFAEKLKSSRYYEYDNKVIFSNSELKHYYYGRATKGALAEMGFMGYLINNDIDFRYNVKVDPNYKWSTDIDFILPNNIRIDVKSGFNYFKPDQLRKNKIDYIVICKPLLYGLPGVYTSNRYTLIRSYRRLFKLPIQIDIIGMLDVPTILNVIKHGGNNFEDFLLPPNFHTYL